MVTIVKVLVSEKAIVQEESTKHLEVWYGIQLDIIFNYEQLLSWMYIQLNNLIHGFYNIILHSYMYIEYSYQITN